MATICSQIFNSAVQVFTGAQTEIVILIFAICAQMIIFGKYRLGSNPFGLKRQRNQKRTKGAGNPAISTRQNGVHTHGAELAQLVMPLLRKGATQDEIADIFEDCFQTCKLETIPNVIVVCLESIGEGLNVKLLAAVRNFLRTHKVKPNGRLNELLLQNCLNLCLINEFDEVLAEVQAQDGGISFGVAVVVLKASIGSSNLKKAMTCLESLANGPPLSSEQRALLQQLVRLAADTVELPALVKELRKYGLVKLANLYNTLLDACIKSQHFDFAEQIMLEAQAAGMADVVTYNTILKARLREGNFSRAHKIIERMQEVGLQPNCVTFNELLDATIGVDTEKAWALINEMKASGLKPNHITCSILLKSVQQNSNTADADKVLMVVNAMDDDMDEVLFSSVLEACIRASRSDLLVEQLKKHRFKKPVQVKGAQTCGSIIRAYGCVGDLKGVKETWLDMQMRCITPTSITLGCAVEALASNGDPEAAHKLTREMLDDAQTRPLVNAVIYCSVLKGFSHLKMFDRVWAVYEEMIAEKFQAQFSSVTYNTLIDACARCGEINRAQMLLEDMVHHGIEPNLVTYSAVLKGYCQENRLDKAFELLESMNESNHVKPDELTYNTLLDGCARQGLYERGMQVFAQMQAAKVRPSNFTLSVLVKLANRGRRLEEAFELCTRLSTKYKFRLNVHVYNNLVQACITHKEAQRALEVLEKMITEKIRPDVRTYTLLLRGCVSFGFAKEAVGLMRAAMGLEGVLPRLVPYKASSVQPRERLPGNLVSEIVESIARQCHDEVLAIQLLTDLRRVPWLTLDPKLSMRLAAKAIQKPDKW